MKKIPELRFSEFSGEWQDKNLGDVLIERNVKCKDGDYEVISSTTNGLYYQKDYFNRDIASDDKSGYKILEREQIVFSPQNLWMGNINFNDSIDIGIVSPSYKIYDIKKNYYPYFIKHIIKTPYMMYQYVQSSEQGASVVRRNLNIELFYSCKVSIPSIEEQKKLANFYNLIDKKIEKQEEKIASIEDYKRGMMQKLFPKKGENIPELRFKGFKDPWEQRKLGEFGYFYYGKSAPKWSVSKDAEIPCVRYGELYTKYSEKIVKIYSYTNIPMKNLKFSTGNEVLVPRVGEDPLDFANCSWLSLPDVAIGEMISVYNTEQNPLFTAYMFNSKLKYEFAKRVEGGNVSNLYYSYLEDILISFPSLAEQEKITSFFSNLDNFITLHRRKLEELKELKKGFMQKMFI